MRNAVFGLCVAFFAAFALSFPSVVMADELSDVKNAGYVGEKPDGYLGIVGGAPANVVAMVEDINRKRKAHYSGIAAENGQSLSVVEALAGEKLVNGTRPGNYYMTRSGQWVQK